jgi:hypothetical protein
MTMRADIERNTASGTDTYGHPVAPVFTALASLPCFIWSRARREVTDGGKTALVEDLRAIFPLTADVQERDEIASVKDRLGAELMSGRFRLAAIQRKHRHIEAALERVQ